MVQVRKLVLAIAAASALSSGMAQALGLGELSVKSTLNQPLVAEIELTQAQGLNAAQVVPSLATTADFAQAGITRQAFLNDLTFTPVINDSGKSVLRITSSRPVREPFVKFLVQVLWPNGRLLREYSLLLDPPKYSPEAAAAAAAASTPAVSPAAPAQLPSTAPAAEQPATPTPAPAPEPAAQTPAAPASDAKPVLYTTSNNDTLWEIAEKVRNGGTVQQTMLAIQALNPDAFIGGNINRLKKGQVLRLPTPQQSRTMPQPQAITEVAAQNQAWRQGRNLPTGARQLDATRRDRAGAAPSQVEAKDNLSLVSAGSNPAAKGAAGDKNLANKLAVAEENLDTARRDNAELKSRMNDLQSQLDKMQRLIQLKSDQLAKMQASGAVVPPAPAASPALPAALVAAPGSPEVAAKPPGEIAPEDALPAGAAQVTTPGSEQPLVVDPVALQDAEEQDPFKQLLNNPVVLGIIGGAVVLLLLLLMLFLARRRNAKAEAEKHRRMARALAEESDFVSDMDMELPQASFDGLDVPPPGVRMAPAAAAGAAAKERPADPLVQAEIHIAYGRMNQAVELLEESVKVDPSRDDIRLKLMEIYAEQGNTKAFAAHERKVVARGKNQAEVEQLKDNNPTIAAAAVTAAAATATAAALAAEMDAKYVESLLLDEAEPAAEPEPELLAPEPEPAPIADDLDNDFDLSLDDLELASPEAVAEPEASPADDDFELDAPVVAAADEPSFETLLRQQNEAVAVSAPDDLDDFDLDLAEDEPALTHEDDFLLSLENDPLDLGETPAVTPEPEPEPEHDLDLPDDFDLSLADEIETDQATQAFASEIDDVNAELERLSQNLESPPMAEPFQTPSFTADDMAAMDDEPEFDFLSGTDEAATKLDLARAYIEMGDSDGARDILDEVVTEGDDSQKTEAREMLGRLA